MVRVSGIFAFVEFPFFFFFQGKEKEEHLDFIFASNGLQAFLRPLTSCFEGFSTPKRFVSGT